ncbi:MAG: cytochrome c, partial [Alphaproteobacteria bacterium]|nr:cytochrome c [Alphaproteobacteria bacterium]
MRIVGLGLVASCAFSSGAFATENSFVDRGDVERGRALVQARCSSCHAVGPMGDSPYPPAPPLRTLNDKYDVEGLAEAFAEGILVGHKGLRQMPEFVFPPEEIDDLIAYLKSLRR